MDIRKGFTLIELVIVIVILGILAAFIVPRFAGLSKEARIGTVSSMEGAMRSAAAIVHSKALTTNATTSVTMEDDTTVDIAFGYPTGAATGMGAALQSTSGFTPTYTTATSTFDKDGAPGTCNAVYTAATAVNVPPVFAKTTTGC